MLLRTLPFVVAALVSTVVAGEGWLTNIDKALEVAKKDKKAVFVEFTGSDWCGPCKNLKATVFDSPEFKEFADKNLVLVELDYPKEKEQSEEQKAYNQKIQAEYGVRGYPTVYILSDEGKPIWTRVGGASDKEEYLKALEKGLKDGETVTKSLTAIEGKEGLEKAKAIDAALKAMPQDLAKAAPYKKLVNELKELDKEDTLGYGAKDKAEAKADADAQVIDEKVKAIMTPVMALAQEGKADEALALFEKQVGESDLPADIQKQLRVGVVINTKLMAGDVDGAVKALEDMKKDIPEGSPELEQINQGIEFLKANGPALLEQIKAMKAMQEAAKKQGAPAGE